LDKNKNEQQIQLKDFIEVNDKSETLTENTAQKVQKDSLFEFQDYIEKLRKIKES